MAALDVEALKSRAGKVLKGFSPSQLVIIGLLGVVAVVGGAAFVRWVTAPTYEVLVAGMEAADAQAVVAKLQADGVQYQLTGGGTTVLVPAAVVDEQRIAMAAAGLPEGGSSGGWETFDAQGMGSSSFQQKVAYQRALQAQLAGTIKQLDGVRGAQVHIALPEDRIFEDEQAPARASVLLDATRVSDETVQSVVHLVASAVPDLDPSDVSVTDTEGRLLTSTDGAPDADRRLEQQRAVEDALTARATTMLEQVLGPGQAVVRVSAQIDPAQSTVESVTYDPDKQVVVSKDASDEQYTTSEGNPDTGVVTEAPTEQGMTTADEYRKTQSSEKFATNQVNETRVVPAGQVQRLTVSVAVNRNAPAAPAPADVQAMVAAAVGLDAARGDVIAVTTPVFPRAEEEEVVEEEPAGGPLAAVSEHGSTAIAVLLLLLVGLGFLRTVRRGTVTELPVPTVTAGTPSAADAQAALAAGGRAALPAGAVPGQRGEPDLLQLVDDNTDEVAALLRGWLAEVGAGERR